MKIVVCTKRKSIFHKVHMCTIVFMLFFFFTERCQEPLSQTVNVRERTTITCNYPGKQFNSDVKSFCRENRFTCETILSTNSMQKSEGPFSLKETSGGFNISISSVSANHTGVYWCAVSKQDYQFGVKRITLQVKGE